MENTRSQIEGRVVYMFAFDIAYDIGGEPIQSLLGQPVAQFSIDTSRRNPRHLYFYRPQMVRLPPVERVGPAGPVLVERTVKLLPLGAITITMEVPFKAGAITDLVSYHDLQFGGTYLHDEVRRLAEEVRTELARYYIRPAAELPQEEAYTVFCIKAPFPPPAGKEGTTEAWLANHRREVAALLTQETDLGQLSKQESDESTGRYLSYYESDLVVVDWDAALIIDEPEDFQETLYVMELANLQLAELEAYDRLLDLALERAYRDVRSRSGRKRASQLEELRELRIDMARLSDQMSNITKFFGDWHLARIYALAAARFHLGEWQSTIESKLQTLDDLYEILKHDQTNRWMLILEITIVLLFIIDLVMLFFHPK